MHSVDSGFMLLVLRSKVIRRAAMEVFHVPITESNQDSHQTVIIVHLTGQVRRHISSSRSTVHVIVQLLIQY